MDNNGAAQLKRDAEAMLRGAESMVRNMEAMTRKTFENLSPEQGQLFAKYFNDAKVGDKLNEVKKQTEELRKKFDHAG